MSYIRVFILLWVVGVCCTRLWTDYVIKLLLSEFERALNDRRPQNLLKSTTVSSVHTSNIDIMRAPGAGPNSWPDGQFSLDVSCYLYVLFSFLCCTLVLNLLVSSEWLVGKISAWHYCICLSESSNWGNVQCETMSSFDASPVSALGL